MAFKPESVRDDVGAAHRAKALLDLFGVDGELGVELARRLVEERRDDIKREKGGLP